MQQPTCPICGEPVPPRATPGRPRRYCSGRCRTEAYRARQALEVEGELDAPQPNPDPIIRAELLAAADALLTDTAAAPPEDQLARAVIETRSLAHQYRRLEPELPRGLSWRAAEAGRRIDAVADELFTPDKEHPQ